MRSAKLCLGALVAAIAVVSCSSEAPTPAAMPIPTEQAPVTRTTSTMDALYAFDVFDQKLLAGISDNIFVGTVDSVLGNQTLSGYPSTQFTVDVVSNLKGELIGSIIVNQPGGIDNQTNELVLFEDDTLLEVGKSYILVTGYNPETSWHTITPVAGHIEITAAEAEVAENAPNARGASLPPSVLQMQDSIAQQVNPEGGDPVPGLILPEQSPPLVEPPTGSTTETVVPTTNLPLPSEGPSPTLTETAVPSVSVPPR